MVTSENQVRHLYVMKGNMQTNTAPTSTNTIQVVDADKKAPYVVCAGKGGLTRSDLITNITSVKVTDADALARKLKSVKLVLDSTVNSGNPIAGQDYIVRILIRQAFGMSDQDQYFKYGCVHATSNMSVTAFYKTLVKSLVMNFSRELTKWFKFYVIKHSDSSAVEIATVQDADAFDGSTDAKKIDGIIIAEAELDWVIGIKSQTPVYFEVVPSTVLSSGDEVIWGVVSDYTATYAQSIGNGKVVADLEYFLMGERGDQYRKTGWPNYIPTEYMVDPTQTYDVLDVHYYFEGANESAAKSEKDITIVTPHANADELVKVAKKLAAAAGMSKYTAISAAGVASQENVA